MLIMEYKNQFVFARLVGLAQVMVTEERAFLIGESHARLPTFLTFLLTPTFASHWTIGPLVKLHSANLAPSVQTLQCVLMTKLGANFVFAEIVLMANFRCVTALVPAFVPTWKYKAACFVTDLVPFRRTHTALSWALMSTWQNVLAWVSTLQWLPTKMLHFSFAHRAWFRQLHMTVMLLGVPTRQATLMTATADMLALSITYPMMTRATARPALFWTLVPATKNGLAPLAALR